MGTCAAAGGAKFAACIAGSKGCYPLPMCFLGDCNRALSGSETALFEGARHLAGHTPACCRCLPSSLLGAVFGLAWHNAHKQQALRISRTKAAASTANNELIAARRRYCAPSPPFCSDCSLRVFFGHCSLKLNPSNHLNRRFYRQKNPTTRAQTLTPSSL
jgi:hypothetical protein